MRLSILGGFCVFPHCVLRLLSYCALRQRRRGGEGETARANVVRRVNLIYKLVAKKRVLEGEEGGGKQFKLCGSL